MSAPPKRGALCRVVCDIPVVHVFVDGKHGWLYVDELEPV